LYKALVIALMWCVCAGAGCFEYYIITSDSFL